MHLDTPLEEAFRLIEPQKKALKRLQLRTVFDLLHHFPSRYTDISEFSSIGKLGDQKRAVIYGRLTKLETKKAHFKKVPYAQGEVEDPSGKLKVIWWNQPYIAKTFRVGSLVRLDGALTGKDGKRYMSNPEIEYSTELPLGESGSLFENDIDQTIYPVYPESKGITSRWMYHKIKEILKDETVLAELIDPIPSSILERYSLPAQKTALFWIHLPKKISLTRSARKRFSFEEIFLIQLSRFIARKKYESLGNFKIKIGKDTLHNFEKRLPFELTAGQKKSIKHIVEDLGKDRPMSRLLEGDVGSGKTAVAALASYAVINTRPEGQDFGNLQVAYMAPTEVLARQLFDSFIEYFSHLPIQIALITGSECRKFPSKVSYSRDSGNGSTHISKSQLLKWVKNGEIAIVIGTHALIQKNVLFKHLAFSIIDEQHRFGIDQRRSLVHKDQQAGAIAPHLLSMTATPIPRTLALTLYADLDLTLLDTMPKGRKKIITEIVPGDERKKTYEDIRNQLQSGRQVYVICPRIDEPDPEKERAIQAKSVKAEAKRLKEKIFPEYEIGVLHSKETPKRKEEIMKDFSEGKIDILVSTSVIEVGVNVPNATVIVIEGAERFGLAQLHQLRGRVLRSTHQAYCYVFTESRSDKTRERLKALKNAKNGFELAELDLSLRGAGELSGKKQWGISDMAMEAIKNIKMVEAARTEAEAMILKDPELKKQPLLKKRTETEKEIHFE